jgi:E3 ubiquitin-protein ligase MUL1
MSSFDRLYKLASMGFAAFGVFLLAKRALEHFLQKKRQHEFHRKYGQTSVPLFEYRG